MVDLCTMQGVWTFIDSLLLHSHTHYAHGITFYYLRKAAHLEHGSRCTVPRQLSKGLGARSRAPHHARACVRRDRTPTRALFVATGRRPRAPARRAFNVERVCRLPTKRGHHGHFSGRAFIPPRPRTGLWIPPLSLSRRSPPLPFAVTVRFAPTFSYGVTRACLPRDALAAAPGP
jgi:hypothetical protein